MKIHRVAARAICFTLMAVSIRGAQCSVSPAALGDEQQSQMPMPRQLLKLNGYITMGAYADGNTFGFLIRDANLVSLGDETIAIFRPLRDQAAFRRSLIEGLDRRSSSLGAYVALNQLYPKHALKLFGDGFYLNGVQTPKFLPLFIQTKAGVHVQRTPSRVMTDIAREYWTDKLLRPEKPKPQVAK